MAIAITGITPDTGVETGSTVARITGTDLDLVTGVTIGGTAVLAFEAESDTLMKVTVPPGSVGAQDVVLAPGAVTLVGGYTYTAASSTETLVSSLARDWALDVNSGTEAAPVWLKVRGIGELKPVIEANMEDDSDYDSDGWASEVKTQLKWSLETKLLRKIGITSGNYDPGQQVIWTAHDKFGADGVVHVRWYDLNGSAEAYTGFASVSWEPDGGDAKATQTVTVKLMGNGRRTLVTNPAA